MEKAQQLNVWWSLDQWTYHISQRTTFHTSHSKEQATIIMIRSLSVDVVKTILRPSSTPNIINSTCVKTSQSLPCTLWLRRSSPHWRIPLLLPFIAFLYMHSFIVMARATILARTFTSLCALAGSTTNDGRMTDISQSSKNIVQWNFVPPMIS